MTKDEYIGLRIAELTVRRDYCAKLVMNRDMAHEVRICDKQIKILIQMQDALKPIVESPLPKIGPLKVGPVTQFHIQGSNPPQLIHTNDNGHDTVLCENHLTDTMITCSNCIQPCPLDN